MWSNADEVKAFIEDHKGGKWNVGDRFVLPDIEQAYEVLAVRPFKHRGKFRLFVDLEAQCAVEDCENYLIVTKEVHQWMSSPHLPRCCLAHRYGFSTPMDMAWKTKDERDELVAKIAAQSARQAVVKTPRVGSNEQAVLDAADELSVLSDQVKVDVLIEHAIGKLPPAQPGKRDTRRQTVVRAVRSLSETQRITLYGGVVLL